MMGEKKATGNLSLENYFSTKENSNNLFTGLDNKGETITVLYKIKSCLDMAGDDTGGTITIEWNNQKLKGCAKLIN